MHNRFSKNGCVDSCVLPCYQAEAEIESVTESAIESAPHSLGQLSFAISVIFSCGKGGRQGAQDEQATLVDGKTGKKGDAKGRAGAGVCYRPCRNDVLGGVGRAKLHVSSQFCAMPPDADTWLSGRARSCGYLFDDFPAPCSHRDAM